MFLHPIAISQNYLSIFPRAAILCLRGFRAPSLFPDCSFIWRPRPRFSWKSSGSASETYGDGFSLSGAAGFVGMSQLNIVFLKKYSNEQILTFFRSLASFAVAAVIFFVCAFNGWFNIYSVVGTMSVFLACVGLANPNPPPRSQWRRSRRTPAARRRCWGSSR